MKHSAIRTVAALAVAILMSTTASAAPFTWVVTGTITNVNTSNPDGPFHSLFQLGDPYTWTINMESSVPDINPSPGCGQYFATTSATLTSGSLSLTSQRGDVITSVGAGNCEIPNGLTRVVNLFGDLILSMHLFAAPPTDALPLIPPSTVGTLDIFYGALTNTRVIRNASVVSVRAVPEPTGLIVLGILAAVQRRRPRNGHQS